MTAQFAAFWLNCTETPTKHHRVLPCRWGDVFYTPISPAQVMWLPDNPCEQSHPCVSSVAFKCNHTPETLNEFRAVFLKNTRHFRCDGNQCASAHADGCSWRGRGGARSDLPHPEQLIREFKKTFTADVQGTPGPEEKPFKKRLLRFD